MAEDQIRSPTVLDLRIQRIVTINGSSPSNETFSSAGPSAPKGPLLRHRTCWAELSTIAATSDLTQNTGNVHSHQRRASKLFPPSGTFLLVASPTVVPSTSSRTSMQAVQVEFYATATPSSPSSITKENPSSWVRQYSLTTIETTLGLWSTDRTVKFKVNVREKSRIPMNEFTRPSKYCVTSWGLEVLPKVGPRTFVHFDA